MPKYHPELKPWPVLNKRRLKKRAKRFPLVGDWRGYMRYYWDCRRMQRDLFAKLALRFAALPAPTAKEGGDA